MTHIGVRFVPMEGDLLSSLDPDQSVIYVRDDATEEEVGRAVFAAVHTLCDGDYPGAIPRGD